MKRRNAEFPKMRKPVKRNKTSEGFFTNSNAYMKILSVWLGLLAADYYVGFRFEFLWSLYLIMNSLVDSVRYQGIAFSMFFICITLTTDMLCYFFIPIHWLFFAATTYIWVQSMWNLDKGICAPTIALWLLFLYLEVGVRLRDLKHLTYLDMSRPFAANCIGYPVVTLGFGFKSYIGFRMRQRKQRDVSKENEFYMQLMQQALPPEAVAPPPPPPPEPASAAAAVVGNAIVPAPVQSAKVHTNTNNKSQHHEPQQQQQRNGHIPNGTIPNGVHRAQPNHHRKSVDKCREHEQHEQHRHSERHVDSSRQQRQQQQHLNHSHSNGSAVGAGVEEVTVTSTTSTSISTSTSNFHEHEQRATRRREKKEMEKEREAAEYLQKLESDAKRLRVELQGSRASEQELRLQVAALTTSEKESKGALSTMQREIEDLQQRYQNAMSTRASDKQTITNLERRVAEERRMRGSLESQLNQERKSRKQEEARVAQVVAQSSRGECTEACRSRRRELEAELSESRAAKHWSEERLSALERENAALVDQLRDMDILMTALSAMQEKNAHLENSLSAETRIKLDLFSALGEAKRQLEIRESSNRTQEREIEELKSKIAQVLAVMPNDSFGSPTSPPPAMSRVRLAESPPGSTLDPNATAYTPKGSLVASTEA